MEMRLRVTDRIFQDFIYTEGLGHSQVLSIFSCLEHFTVRFTKHTNATAVLYAKTPYT